MNAMLLEEHSVEEREGILEAPWDCIDAYEEAKAEGIPSAFAFYKDKWYVIGTAGQGPFIIWEDK